MDPHPVINDAESPFNDDPSRLDRGEYVVIRTLNSSYGSTWCDFHVHRRFVCCPGSFFSNILGDARPAEYKREMPVVVLNDEHSDVIRDLLLLCCSPETGEYPSFGKDDRFWRVLGAAQKYCLESDQFLQHSKNSLESSSMVPERLYVIGVRNKWEDICKLAAKRAVDISRVPLLGCPFTLEESQYLTPEQISAFLDYKDSAKRLVHDYINDITFNEDRTHDYFYVSSLSRESLPFNTTSYSSADWKELGHSGECEAKFKTGVDIEVPERYDRDGLPFTSVIRAPRWWQQYLRDVAEKFEHYPHRSVLTDVSLIKQAVIRATEYCPKCSEDTFDISFRMFEWVINGFVVGIQHKADMMDVCFISFVRPKCVADLI